MPTVFVRFTAQAPARMLTTKPIRINTCIYSFYLNGHYAAFPADGNSNPKLTRWRKQINEKNHLLQVFIMIRRTESPSPLNLNTSEFTFTYSRSSGAGGQNVNKVNSRVTLRWDVIESQSISEAHKQRFLKAFSHRVTAQGDILISSEKTRDQKRNQIDCIEKLLALLEQVRSPQKTRRPTKPTKASHDRRLNQKKANSTKKETRQKIRFTCD